MHLFCISKDLHLALECLNGGGGVGGRGEGG